MEDPFWVRFRGGLESTLILSCHLIDDFVGFFYSRAVSFVYTLIPECLERHTARGARRAYLDLMFTFN